MKIRHIILVLLLSALTSWAVTHNQAPIPAAPTTKETAFERVKRTHVLRCAYISWSATYFQKDPNTGTFRGFGYDLAEALSQVMGLKIEWSEEVGVGTMFEGLQTGRYDAICTPVFQDALGAQSATFTRPSHYSPLYAYARGDDTRFTAQDPHVLDKINDPAITVVDVEGSNAVEVQKNRYPDAKRFFLPATTPGSEVMMNVMSGKADITQQIPLVVDDALQNNPGALNRVSPALTVFPTSMIILPKGDYALKEWFDMAIESMLNMGTIDKILDQYDPTREKLLRVGKPYNVPGAPK